MVRTALVKRQAADVAKLADEFQSQISDSLDQVASIVGESIRASFSSDLIPTSHSAALNVSKIEQDFISALRICGFYEVISAFVDELVVQANWAQDVYDDERKRSQQLPAITYDNLDTGVLADQAGSTIAAYDGLSLKAVSAIRSIVFRNVGGGSSVSSLIDDVTETIRNMANVKQMSIEHMMIFFRLCVSLFVDFLDRSGLQILLSYAGENTASTRDFCINLIGKKYWRSEIDAMDNGQIPGVFLHCGGYGCCHWWSIFDVR